MNWGGLIELREKISDLYENVVYKDIAVFNGGEETIYVTAIEYGNELIMHDPCFQSLSAIAEDIGCNVVHFRQFIMSP